MDLLSRHKFILPSQIWRVCQSLRMQRQLLVLKSSPSPHLSTDLVEETNTQLQTIQDDHSQASPTPLLRQLPDANGEWVEKLQISTTSSPPSVLAAPLHQILSSLPPPTSSILSIVWISTDLSLEMEPSLFGALQRATSWHQATLLLISPLRELPGWLEELGAKMISVDNIRHYLAPNLLWQGNLSFYHEEVDTGPMLLPLGSCHLQAPSSLSRQLNPLGATNHLSPLLEVIASPHLSDLPRHLFTDMQVELVTTKDTDISSFLISSLASSEQTLLLRLNYSEDSPRCEQLTTEEWKRQVVEGTWGLNTPKPSLGHKLASHHILVYRQPLPDKRLTVTHSVFAGVLISPLSSLTESVHPRLAMAAPGREPSQLNTKTPTSRGEEAPLKALLDLPVLSLPPHLLHQVAEWIVRVRDEVEKQLSPACEDKEKILLAVQEKLLTDLLERESRLEVSSRLIEEADFVEAEEKLLKEKDSSGSLGEEWQEKRFLRFLEAHDEVTAKEKEKTEGANLLAPPDHDYVVLEAKELMKYFTEEGKPSNELQEVRASSRKCLQRPQKSADDYKSFLSENFERIVKDDFQFPGFKFIGSNLEGSSFSTVEFTQFHDVYYNTGDGAETQDRECKERKDQLVGMSRETGSSVCAVAQPQRLRVDKKTTAVPTSRRSSPRKALAPASKSPLKQVETKPSLKDLQKPGKAKVGQNPARRSLVASSSSGGTKDSQKKPPADDLTDINRKKLRTAVYECLLRKDIQEKTPLFRPCFAKLFNICKMYVIENQISDPESNSKSSMLEMCKIHVESVIGMEKMMSRRKK